MCSPNFVLFYNFRVHQASGNLPRLEDLKL